jgi:hypothetical protein
MLSPTDSMLYPYINNHDRVQSSLLTTRTCSVLLKKKFDDTFVNNDSKMNLLNFKWFDLIDVNTRRSVH